MLSQAARFGFLLDGLDSRVVDPGQPFNAAAVPDGGVAVLKAYQRDTKAKVMEVPIVELGQDIALYLRIHRAREEVTSVGNVLLANENAVLKRISDRVQEGLRIGGSVIDSDGKLSRLLGPARAIRSKPASTAQATKAEKARNEQAVRADEQAKAKAAAEPAKAATTTVSTTLGQTDPTKK